MKIRLKKFLSKVMDKCEKMYIALTTALILNTVCTTNVFATQPKIVSGTVKLFQSATTWLLLIIPVGAGFFLGYHALQKSLTDDQAVIAEKNKLMKNVLIGAIIAETASGLTTLILSFYS